MFLQILEGKAVGNKNLKIADVLPRTSDKNSNGTKNPAAKIKSAREAVTPLADLSYAEQLEQKKASIMQTLKKLVKLLSHSCFVFYFAFGCCFSSFNFQQTDLVGNVFFLARRGMRVKLVQMENHFQNGFFSLEK